MRPSSDPFWNPFKAIRKVSKGKKRHFDYYRIPALEPLFTELFTPIQQIELEIQKEVQRWAPDWKESLRQWAQSQGDKIATVLRKLKKIQWKRPNVSLPPARKALEKAAEKTLNGFKHFLKQSLRVSVASASLFLIGFVLMNAPAYGDVIKTSFLTWTGAPDDTSLEDHFVKADPVQQEILAFSNNPEEQKEAIPLLALRVTPPDNRLIIPKLDKNVPIIESDPEKLLNADWATLEDTFQDDLQNGVLHYPGTADPGEAGNVFITGHSSYYLWDSGRYKDVFARLAKLEVGDDIILYYDQQKYHYRVRETKEVKKDDVSVLSQTDEHLLTLMTCVPLGTNLRRLIVVAEEV